MRKAAGLIAAILLAGVAAAWWVVRGSLPVLDGEVRLDGLGGPVTVARDAGGVPTITADTRQDLARATGFVHAQDRFFQMDLLRRQAAGELSALFGPAAVPADQALRLHRFRALAEGIVGRAPADHRAVLDAYAQGVNAGLAALSARPFEYLLLRETPQPWRPADSLLVLYSMFLELHDERGDRESELALMEAVLPAEFVAFLAPAGTPWDAPLTGAAMPGSPIPGPEVMDLRELDLPEAEARAAGRARLTEPVTPGSNSWVLAGSRTADGRALVANDMHLPLRVPNIFYRVRLRVTGHTHTHTLLLTRKQDGIANDSKEHTTSFICI